MSHYATEVCKCPEKAAQMYMKRYSLGDNYGYNQLAYMYAKGHLGAPDFSKALSLINTIIKAEPTNYDFLDSKGEILLIKGDIKGARKIWNTINKKSPLFYSNYIKENEETTVLDEYMKNSK